MVLGVGVVLGAAGVLVVVIDGGVVLGVGVVLVVVLAVGVVLGVRGVLVMVLDVRASSKRRVPLSASVPAGTLVLLIDQARLTMVLSCRPMGDPGHAYTGQIK